MTIKICNNANFNGQIGEKEWKILYNIKEVRRMVPENLQELVREIVRRKAEAQNIEVKSAHRGCPKRLYDTLSSFSNQDEGGVIVFGLDEAEGFAPVGVYDLQDLQKKVTEQCQQMRPPVRARPARGPGMAAASWRATSGGGHHDGVARAAGY